MSEKYGVPVVSIGTLLKEEVDSGSTLGADIQKGQKGKRQVHDDLVLQVLLSRLAEEDVAAGFVLEGGPKNDVQAKGIDAFLLRQGHAFAGVVLLKYDYDEFMEAMTGQRSCRECGAQFNIYTNPPIVERICDYCGGRLHSRVDDREEKISRRLREYEAIEKPLVAYCQARIVIVEGNFESDRVYKVVQKAADRLKNAAPKTQPSSIQQEGGAAVDKKKKGTASKKKKSGKKGGKVKGGNKVKSDKLKSDKVKGDKKKGGKKKVAATKQEAANKRDTSKKSVSKKAAPKKAAPKKAAPKKAAPKKAATKKAAPKKAATKKAASKKVAPKKVALKRVAPKKAAPKKVTKRKNS